MAEVEQVERAIARFCHEVLEEPLCFFSEGDLQVRLYMKLWPDFGTSQPTAVRRTAVGSEVYKTPLLHREYGAGGKSRMDLLIFSPKTLPRS